jgi:hypothetical protein
MNHHRLLNLIVDAEDSEIFGVPEGFRLFATLEQSVHWLRLRDRLSRCPIVTGLTWQEVAPLAGDIGFFLSGGRAMFVTTDGERFRFYAAPVGPDSDLVSLLDWVRPVVECHVP